jgi:hypothetical protein
MVENECSTISREAEVYDSSLETFWERCGSSTTNNSCVNVNKFLNLSKPLELHQKMELRIVL